MIPAKRLAEMRENAEAANTVAGPLAGVRCRCGDLLELVTAYEAARGFVAAGELRGFSPARTKLLALFPEPTKVQPSIPHDPNNDFCPCFGCNGMRMCTD